MEPGVGIKVATLLKSAGYEVTALDMAASAVHPKGEEKARSMVFILYAFLMSYEITGPGLCYLRSYM